MGKDGFVVSRWETASGTHQLATRGAADGAVGHVRRYAGYVERGENARREVAVTGVGLMLAFGDPLVVDYGQGGPRQELGAFVVGNHTRPAWTRFSGRQAGVQVDLTAAGAYALFGEAVAQLTDQSLPLEDVMGRDGSRLVEKLATTESWSGRFSVLDAVIGARAGPAFAPEVAWVAAQVRKAQGAGPVEALLRSTGFSYRYLAGRFRRQVGLSPKAYARVVRFEHAVGLLNSREPGTSLAEVAAAAGYSDQAHFDRDFRSLGGCTPSEYLAEAEPEPEVRFVQDQPVEGSVASLA